MTRRITLAITLTATCWLPVAALAAPPGPSYARVDIDGVGADRLRQARETPGLHFWVELDDRLLVLAGEQALNTLELGFTVERLAVAPRPSRLHLVRGARRDELAAMDVDVLAMGGRHAVVQARRDGRPGLPGLARHAALLPFQPDRVLSRQRVNEPTRRLALAPAAAALIDEVDAQRWLDDVGTLAGYNRHTHNSGVLDARDWLVEQLEAMPGLSVTTPSFQVGGTTAYNVVATLAGTTRPEDLYIVGGHYDSTSQSPQVSAPGAEDNASGCAGVLEMARIFTAHPPDGTILFMCYSGEEQGLVGSVDHASGLVAAGLDDDVEAVLTMDMIGYTGDADLDCLLETSAGNAALVDVFAAAAELTDLRIVISFNPFGSDHVPYLDRGMPALLTIENDWASYPCYHNTCDLPDGLDLAMGREVLAMNVVALAQLTGPGTMIFADGFESGDSAAWENPPPGE